MKDARAEERKLRQLAKETSKKLTPMQKKELVKKAKATRKAAAVSALAKKTRQFRNPVDTDEEDELMDSLLLKGSDAWKEEFKQGGLAWQELYRTSESFNIEDPYWSNMFIKKAFEILESYSEQATEDVPYEPDRNLTLAPTMGPQVAKTQQVFDPNNLVLPSTPYRNRRKDREETDANSTPLKRLHELTEGAGMYNTLASFLEERNLWNAELNSTDQDEEARAVNTTAAVIVPDETAQIALAEVDKALDNTKLQREDLAKAKATFGIPDDADKLNVPGMRTSIAATHWQLLAADAMVDAFNDDRITGLLLADDVGLGKTWSCISFLLKVRGI
jgi:SNF2 family DNA or RNA helicase